MSGKRPSATPDEVTRRVDEIIDYHRAGRESLKETGPVEDQAADLGWNVTKLRKARQFARPDTGYSQDRLDELCDLLAEHRPVFGTSHVGLLVTVPMPEREHLQRECVENNWSLRNLKTAIKTRFGVRRLGGRKREVGPDDVLVRLEDTTTSWRRLLAAAKKGQGGEPPALGRLSKGLIAKVRAVHLPMMRLRDAVQSELAAAREGAG